MPLYVFGNKENNYIFLKGDIKWSNCNIIKCIILASFTGIISTYMGIGGSMLIVPLLIGMEMKPQIVIATVAVSTFFSSLISTINYAIAGLLYWKYAFIYSLLSALGALIGLLISDIMVRKIKKTFILIFIVCFVILISIILLIINSIINSEGLLDFKIELNC